MTPRQYLGSYIQGQFVNVNDPNGEVHSTNPGDLEQDSLACGFSFAHVNESIGAARESFPSWKRMPVGERYAAVGRYRDLLMQRAEELANLVTFETGKPLWESRLEIQQTGALIEDFIVQGSQTAVMLEVPNAGPNTLGVVRHISRGVVVVIAPGITPVHDSHAQWIPALLNGNTVVMKANRHAPLVGQAMAQTIHDCGLPSGIFNLIQGDFEVSKRLCCDPDVDAVFFTGSYETGLTLKKQTVSDYQKLLVLEMTGKNGSLVWDDCNYARALHESLYAAFLTTGQRRHNTNRILVHHKIFDRFLGDFHALAKRCKVGIGTGEGDKAPFMGPLLTEAAVESYVRFQGIAVREGCEEIMRGKPLERDENGHYVAPSIHWVHRADPKSVYQKSEIFGPNVALYRVQDLEEAIDILNLPQHGLVASVYTQSREIYVRAAEEVRVGMIHWNRPTTHTSHRVPSGGIKKSGNSRPMGSYAGLQCTFAVSALEFQGTGDGLAELPEQLPRSSS